MLPAQGGNAPGKGLKNFPPVYVFESFYYLPVKMLSFCRSELIPVVGDCFQVSLDPFPVHRMKIENEGRPPIGLGHRVQVFRGNNVSNGQTLPQCQKSDQGKRNLLAWQTLAHP